MPKNLLIVESPAKAKTIEKFLGSDFKVVSSIGHIREIPKKGIGIEIENNFTPVYEILPDKKKLVQELKKHVKNSENVYLSTDDDREGEAIAWHLCIALNLDPSTTPRITFNEITKTAISNAILQPRTLNMALVDAQKTRRVLDRLVGYELSPILWRKVSGANSAGRVQSPSTRLVVERERSIQAFETQSKYECTAVFSTPNDDTITSSYQVSLESLESAKELLQALTQQSFFIHDIAEKSLLRNPSPPFTTSTLQQEASSRLSFSVKQTMTLAQNLYRTGHITYMRTDSTHLSSLAIKDAQTTIQKMWGNEYLKTRQYQTKSSNAQEAHEAIRPTYLHLSQIDGLDPKEQRLYQLIWKRTLASQMQSAQIACTDIVITTKSNDLKTFKARGELLKFKGFLMVYDYEQFKDKLLSPIQKSDVLKIQNARCVQTFSKPKSRYTEASLVRQLEKLGIGRPSTYAAMVSTIQERGYVEKTSIEPKQRVVHQVHLENNFITETQKEENYGSEKNKLIPTPVAELTTDFLMTYFQSIIDYDFTALMEKNLDTIATGKINSQDILEPFYKEFHETIVSAQDINKQDLSTLREVGEDPKTKKPISIRLGRFGPFVQIGLASDEEKPVFANVPKTFNIQEASLEDVLTLFSLPRTLGETEKNEPILANNGRFGPYLKVGEKFVSIPDHDPNTITLETAKRLILEKEKADKEKQIKLFENSDIKILNGRFGPYITNGKKRGAGQINASVKKVFKEIADDLEKIKKLSLEECEKALKNFKKNPAKKTTVTRKKK